VSGDAFIDGIAFITQVDTGFVDATNLSSVNVSLVNLSATRSSIDNLCVANITITGNITANDLNLSTGNLVPGDNITIENNIISAYLSSNSQANLNSLQVDNNLDVFGVLNVSQTSTFGGSLNVSNIIYSGVAGQHEGSLVLYSNIVGNNFTQTYNSSGTEIDITATGTATAINYFVGDTNVLRISPNAFEVNAIDANIIDTNELTANVFTCIDGEATFRFTTPTINADVGIITDLNASDANFSSITATDLTLTGSEFPLTIPNGQLNVRQINISRAFLMEGSDSFFGSAFNASNMNGGLPRSRNKLLVFY